MVVTIKDVAKEAGVSPGTVSRVLSGQKKFYGLKAEAKVLEAAAKLGYQKNILASNLVKKKNNVIAVVISSVQTNFADSIIRGINKVASENSFDVIYTYTTSLDEGNQPHVIDMLTSRRVSGIVLASVILDKESITKIERADIPYTFVSITPENETRTISSDDVDIGYQATKYLINQGHRRIGLAGLDNQYYTGKRRFEGYKKALKEINVSPKKEWLFPGDYSYESGYDALKYYKKIQNVTAVITASDTCAVGMLNSATDNGVRIPEELSILSIDGTNLCEIARPRLTSVSQNFEEMGQQGILALIDMIKFKSTEISRKVIDVKIDERDSVKRI